MTEKEKQELYENIRNDINCGTFVLAPQYVNKLLAKYIYASITTQEAKNEKQRERLTEAKEIIGIMRHLLFDVWGYIAIPLEKRVNAFLKNN